MKITRILLMALTAVVIAATVASASPPVASQGQGAAHTAGIAALAVTTESDPVDETTDDGTTDEVTTDETTTDEGTTDEVCVDTTTDEVTTDEVTTDEVTTDEVTTDETCGDGTEVLVEDAPLTFADCVGLTGLDNAICRHIVLLGGSEDLLESEDDHGLSHALGQLEENKARHDGETTEVSDEDGTTDEGTDEGVTTTSDDTSDGSPGKSGESHGKSGESHGNSGH